MVKFDNVTKFYPSSTGPNYILKEFSFAFPKDKNIGILGLNGAGKSTILRLIAGAEPPNKGKIHRLCRLSWPMAFTGGFNGSLSGEENVRFVSRIYGADPNLVSQYVVAFSELGEKYHEPFKSYSTGMRSKLAFGLSLAIDFDCYLVDEVLSVGDQRFQSKCREALNSRRKNSFMMLVSHSPNKIKQYCDVAVILHKGSFRYYEDLEEAMHEYDKNIVKNKAA